MTARFAMVFALAILVAFPVAALSEDELLAPPPTVEILDEENPEINEAARKEGVYELEAARTDISAEDAYGAASASYSLDGSADEISDGGERLDEAGFPIEDIDPNRIFTAQRLPRAVPGEVEYFQGDFPERHVTALAVLPLDHLNTPGIVMMTSGSMEIFGIARDNYLIRKWKGEFVKSYPRRGIAASVFSGFYRGRRMVFVSMNKFSKSFAYSWNTKTSTLEKAGQVNSYFVDMLPMKSVHLMGDYGEGVISRAGASLHFVETSAEDPVKTSFPLTDDFYSGCIMRWTNVSAELARIAIVTETGAIKIFQGPSKLMARTPPDYGGRIVCGPRSQNGSFLFTTTQSETDDEIVTLKYSNGLLEETWRSAGFGGAIRELADCDLDDDGEKELLGILETPSGREMLFRILPKNENFAEREEIDAVVDVEVDAVETE